MSAFFKTLTNRISFSLYYRRAGWSSRDKQLAQYCTGSEQSAAIWYQLFVNPNARDAPTSPPGALETGPKMLSVKLYVFPQVPQLMSGGAGPKPRQIIRDSSPAPPSPEPECIGATPARSDLCGSPRPAGPAEPQQVFAFSKCVWRQSFHRS